MAGAAYVCKQTRTWRKQRAASRLQLLRLADPLSKQAGDCTADQGQGHQPRPVIA